MLALGPAALPFRCLARASPAGAHSPEPRHERLAVSCSAEVPKGVARPGSLLRRTAAIGFRLSPDEALDGPPEVDMPEARQIGLGFAIVGIALLVQGCWEDEEFALLGNGGCRTADDRHGAFTTVSTVSLDDCQGQCSEIDEQCTAVEYIADDGNCEIHSEPITRFEEKEGVACYATK
jgi:PAN domain